MASLQALSSATQDRKARLAQLKSLKRKQPHTPEEQADASASAPKSPRQEGDISDLTRKYISGRNYDHETRGAKLGFENAPDHGQETLEKKAAALADHARLKALEEEKSAQPLDLFKIQPKKPNWDLKRDLGRKLDVLNVRTDNAIARLVRERISNQQKAAQARVAAQNDTNGGSQQASFQQSGDIEAMGIEGTTLVEATNVREREDEEEARREREEDEALLDGS